MELFSSITTAEDFFATKTCDFGCRHIQNCLGIELLRNLKGRNVAINAENRKKILKPGRYPDY